MILELNIQNINMNKEIKLTPMKYVEKGWGGELWVVNKEYCGKLLYFKKGKRLSFHRHTIKNETFFLMSGKLILKYGWEPDIHKANQTLLLPGSHFEIPVGLCHQMIAEEDSLLIEFSTHHEDADSERIVKGD